MSSADGDRVDGLVLVAVGVLVGVHRGEQDGDGRTNGLGHWFFYLLFSTGFGKGKLVFSLLWIDDPRICRAIYSNLLYTVPRGEL